MNFECEYETNLVYGVYRIPVKVSIGFKSDGESEDFEQAAYLAITKSFAEIVKTLVKKSSL